MKADIKLVPAMMDPNYEWDARGTAIDDYIIDNNDLIDKELADGMGYMVSVIDMDCYSVSGKCKRWIPIATILENAG